MSLVGWLVGTGEVWLALQFLGHPVDWVDALLLESVGQAIRGAAFAIPGSLGVQEGGYLLLAPLVGLPPETALALSLAKRAREIALGLAGHRLPAFLGTPLAATPSGRHRPDMRAIILAAGRGMRLQQDDAERFPKCLLRFDGTTLLERHLRLLDAAGIDDVVLALGWQPQLVEGRTGAPRGPR